MKKIIAKKTTVTAPVAAAKKVTVKKSGTFKPSQHKIVIGYAFVNAKDIKPGISITSSLPGGGVKGPGSPPKDTGNWVKVGRVLWPTEDMHVEIAIRFAPKAGR